MSPDSQRVQVKMKDLENKIVFVTGAAGGLGLETAKAFARKGSLVIAVDIDAKRLEQAELLLREIKPECRAFAVDLTSKESVKDLAGKIIGSYGGVDVIVNVAGVVMLADFADSPLDKWKWVVEVNLFGQVHPIHYLLPSMISRNSGHIVNVSSAAGLLPIPSFSAYTASKYASVGFSHVLSQELREKGITVTNICPGPMNTPMLDTAEVPVTTDRKWTESFLKYGMYWKRFLTSPERLARLAVRSVQEDKSGIVTTRGIKTADFIFKYFPGLYNQIIKGVRSGMNSSKRMMKK